MPLIMRRRAWSVLPASAGPLRGDTVGSSSPHGWHGRLTARRTLPRDGRLGSDAAAAAASGGLPSAGTPSPSAALLLPAARTAGQRGLPRSRSMPSTLLPTSAEASGSCPGCRGCALSWASAAFRSQVSNGGIAAFELRLPVRNEYGTPDEAGVLAQAWREQRRPQHTTFGGFAGSRKPGTQRLARRTDDDATTAMSPSAKTELADEPIAARLTCCSGCYGIARHAPLRRGRLGADRLLTVPNLPDMRVHLLERVRQAAIRHHDHDRLDRQRLFPRR